MNLVQKTWGYVKAHREPIKQKVVVTAGSIIGMVITGALVDLAKSPRRPYLQRVIILREDEVGTPEVVTDTSV